MYLPIEQRLATRPYNDSVRFAVETLLEKGSGLLNEDVLLKNGNLFGVFDGATSLVPDDLPPGQSGGLLAARIAAHTFRRNGNTLPGCAATANLRINRAMCRKGIAVKQRHRLWSASAAVVRVADTHFEYCQTGDSLIFCLHRDGSYRQLTPETDHDRETLELWKQTPEKAASSIHETLAEQILKVRLQMNIGYGVLNGEPEAMHFLQHGRVSLDGVEALVLFTDGLFLPRTDPAAESDWDTFIGLYRQGGLAAIRDHVRSLQRQDPDCRLYPRFKRHDDIAAIAISFDAR